MRWGGALRWTLLFSEGMVTGASKRQTGSAGMWWFGVEFCGILARISPRKSRLVRNCPLPTTSGWLCPRFGVITEFSHWRHQDFSFEGCFELLMLGTKCLPNRTLRVIVSFTPYTVAAESKTEPLLCLLTGQFSKAWKEDAKNPIKTKEQKENF